MGGYSSQRMFVRCRGVSYDERVLKDIQYHGNYVYLHIHICRSFHK